MAEGNLNKKGKNKTEVPYTAWKLIPKGSLSIKVKIPPFGPHFIIISKTVS